MEFMQKRKEIAVQMFMPAILQVRSGLGVIRLVITFYLMFGVRKGRY